jgi:tetratricopeptide (TPR) repeat protein
MSSESSTLTKLDDAAVELAAGGTVGRGGCSGPPPSAMTETASASENAIANRRLFIVGLPPFSEADEQNIISHPAPSPEYLFAQFWELHCAHAPHKALETCDRLLEVIDPADFTTHLRQTNARGEALRALKRFRDSYAVHLSARPFVPHAPARFAGDHHHGLAMSLTEMGEHARASEAFDVSLRLYRDAGEPGRVARTYVNVARLYVAAERPGLAHQLLDTLEPSADAEIARATAYEKEGNRTDARKAIARAFTLLADSTNEATRTEAVQVFERIEGGMR